MQNRDSEVRRGSYIANLWSVTGLGPEKKRIAELFYQRFQSILELIFPTYPEVLTHLNVDNGFSPLTFQINKPPPCLADFFERLRLPPDGAFFV